MTLPPHRANYRIGSLYSLLTAALLATQEPFSALAASRLSSLYFIGLTQFALLLSVPLLILPRASRRDFVALLSNVENIGKLAILFAVGLIGLYLYNIGLSSAHPIITAAILNLSPFWAALVAKVVSGKSMPISPRIFLACFGVAFIGAMVIAVSQMDGSNSKLLKDVYESALHSRWIYGVPMPIFFALSGTLVGKWFSEYDESASISANFMFSSVMLIPSISIISYLRPANPVEAAPLSAIMLLLLGTLAAAAAGRVIYQVALTTTDNDNGFVTMFFLLIPVLSSLISWPLSWWIADLRIVLGPMFFSGLALVSIPLLVFSAMAWHGHANSPEIRDQDAFKSSG
jgi:drug/metabolite transporter (DMT)-like permease